MTKPAFEIINPRNSLRDKVAGSPRPVLDAGALARAEAALKSLSGQFQAWMEEEVTKLEGARAAARAAGWTEEALRDVHARAHDAKGMGTTCEYPIVTRIAASLCRMLETEEHRTVAKGATALIDAHVDAIRAAVKGRIKSDEDPVGRVLAGELDTRVAALMQGLPD